MLRIYEVIIELLRLLKPVFDEIGRHDPDLARQGRRAAVSIGLNCAEASGVRGGNRRVRMLTSLGSARETQAACDIGEAFGCGVGHGHGHGIGRGGRRPSPPATVLATASP